VGGNYYISADEKAHARYEEKAGEREEEKEGN
jgi:hypothetical protein